MKLKIIGAILAGLALSTGAAFGPQDTEEAAPKGPHLDQIKRLAGTWVALDDDGEPTEKVVSRYSVTAAGSAVLEILFPGTDQEMVTVYHQNGDDLVLTHYCVMGNQPYMKAKKDSGKDRIVFEAVRVGNAKSDDEPAMRKGTVHFRGPDRISSEWLMIAGGEVTYEASFDLARLKDGGK